MSKKMDILSVFLRDYHNSYSGREIARLTKVSPQTALIVLSDLLKEKIVLVEAEGRNKKYSLNLKDLRTKLMLALVESYKARFFAGKLHLTLILDKLLPLAETIIVFGSFAKGREKESSDLDLVVIGVKNKKKFNEVKRIFPREINPHFVTWTEFVRMSNSNLFTEIKKDHLVYGNAYKLVEVYGS